MPYPHAATKRDYRQFLWCLLSGGDTSAFFRTANGEPVDILEKYFGSSILNRQTRFDIAKSLLRGDNWVQGVDSISECMVNLLSDLENDKLQFAPIVPARITADDIELMIEKNDGKYKEPFSARVAFKAISGGYSSKPRWSSNSDLKLGNIPKPRSNPEQRLAC